MAEHVNFVDGTGIDISGNPETGAVTVSLDSDSQASLAKADTAIQPAAFNSLAESVDGLAGVMGEINTSVATLDTDKQNNIPAGTQGVAIGYSGAAGTVQAATKLGTSTVGSTSMPIYLSAGVPLPIDNDFMTWMQTKEMTKVYDSVMSTPLTNLSVGSTTHAYTSLGIRSALYYTFNTAYNVDWTEISGWNPYKMGIISIKDRRYGGDDSAGDYTGRCDIVIPPYLRVGESRQTSAGYRRTYMDWIKMDPAPSTVYYEAGAQVPLFVFYKINFSYNSSGVGSVQVTVEATRYYTESLSGDQQGFGAYIRFYQ